MAVGTTAFPTSLDTAVELVEIKNNASSTLSGNVLIGDVTIGVTDIAEFPTTGFGTLTDDLTTPTKTEIISWTGISGSNLTGCTRGAQGTSAAAFSSGNFIEVRPTAGHHEALRGAVIAIETKIGSGSAIAVNKLAALTASRLMVTDASGFASAASVTAAEAGYLSGVTSAIQTQLGNKQGLDATLTALAAYATNGILTQTAADTFAGRTITGTSAKIDVSNGDGVSGNPTLTISATYAGQTSITTLGTVTTGTLSTGAVIGGVTMTLGSDADGDIYYRSSGVLTRLAKGTALQQLRINAGATAPEWATISGGGGGDALVANPLSQFAATTSLQLLGVISDETGTGALVFGTSPVLTTPDINGGTADSLTSLSVRSTGAAFDLLFANAEVLTGNKTLTFKVNDTNRTVDLAGNLTLAAAFSTSGANALTLTTTGATNVTLPTTGTLVNSAVTSLSSLTTVGTITSGGLSTGAVLGGVTITLGSDADGDIYYRSSNVLTRLAKGTALQQLRMNAGATAPEWATISGGGGLTIGTTAITSGTAGRILYETSGNVVGETAGFSYQPAASPNLTITAQAASYVGLRINSAATPSVDIFQTTVNGGAGTGFVVTSTGAPSSPGAGTNSERYGSGATAASNNSVVIGNGATGTGGGANVVIGQNAASSGAAGVMIGRAVSLTVVGAPFYGIVIGDNSQGGGTNGVTIGNANAISNNGSGIVIGHNNTISSSALGTFFVVSNGSSTPITDWYSGKGPLSASPTAYTINGTGGSGNNIAGADVVIAGGKNTGSPTSTATGNVRLATSIVGAAASTLNTLVDRLVIANRKTLTDASTNLFEVALPTLKGCMGTIRYEIYASDGTDIQVRRGQVQFSAVNKAGSYTTEIAILNEAVSASTGTLTATWGITGGTNKVTIDVTPTGSLTETTYYILYTIENNSEQAITIL